MHASSGLRVLGINTGWVKGGYGVGERISLKYTRAIIDAIHSGELAKQKTTKLPIFNLEVPTACRGVPEEILMPHKAWSDQTAYMNALTELAKKFNKNFELYAEGCSPEILAGGPQLQKTSGASSDSSSGSGQ